MYQLIEQNPRTRTHQQLCRLAEVPRSGYYRRTHSVEVLADPVRSELHHICCEYPRYGYRRVTKELHRRGILVNHKRILALMHKENLLCRRKRRFVHTTDSGHTLRVYPNLARALVVTHPNQLWVADITYVRLTRSFAYLAVILDAYSRRIIGWAISASLETKLSLEALRMALATRLVTSGLIHHSDRGVQYAASDYIALLKSKNIAISMSRKGNPYDNAKAESFMKTLKTEEVYLNDYTTLLDAKMNIERFIDQVYNHKRLHSSLGYRPPVEFEAQHLNPSTLTLENSVSV